MPGETFNLTELAELTGRDEDYWRRNWLRRHRVDGFPRRIAGCWAWNRQLVTAWLRGGPVEAPANDNPFVLPDPQAAFRAAMSQRFGVAE